MLRRKQTCEITFQSLPMHACNMMYYATEGMIHPQRLCIVCMAAGYGLPHIDTIFT